MASIRKRHGAKGAGYQVRYYGPDGKLRSRTFPRKNQAVDFANSVESDIARGSWIDPKEATTPLHEYVDGYLASAVHLRPSTRVKVQGHLRNYIVPSFGDYALVDIRPTDIREFVAALTDHGLAPGTVRAVYATLSRVLRQAVEDGSLLRSPCIGVRLPKDTQREMRFLAPDEIDRLAAAVNERHRVLIYTAAYTGLRWGELAALKVKNVDLVGGSLKVCESLSEINGYIDVGPTKTGATRTVSLPRFLIQMISKHLKEYPSDTYLFTSVEGKPLRRNFYQREFVPAVARAGLETGVRFHDLRHTCAALLIAQGAHPKEIQERMGHSTIRVTFDRYGHLFPSLDERLREGLDQIYREARARTPNG